MKAQRVWRVRYRRYRSAPYGMFSLQRFIGYTDGRGSWVTQQRFASRDQALEALIRKTTKVTSPERG